MKKKPRRFDEHEAAGTRKFKGWPTLVEIQAIRVALSGIEGKNLSAAAIRI